MDLKQLTDLGGVRPAALVPVEVTWARLDDVTGEDLSTTFTVHVRRLAYIDQERIFVMSGMFDNEVDLDDDVPAVAKPAKSANAALIVTAVRFGKEGEEDLTYEMACNLHPTLAMALIGAINKVNPLPPSKKKALAKRSNVARVGAKRSRGKDDRGSKAKPVS